MSGAPSPEPRPEASDRAAAENSETSAAAGPRQDEGPAALFLARLACEAGRNGVIHLARSEARAERLAGVVAAFSPDLDTVLLPAWDCLPYDRASPSRDTMGRRVDAVTRLSAERDRPVLVVATTEAVLQRLPPRDAVAQSRLGLAAGAALDLVGLQSFLDRTGYASDERVDEPGEAALRGEVIDIFPPASPRPFRIEHLDERIVAIHAYDPITQRSTEPVDRIVIGAASELVLAPESESQQERFPGAEHWLPQFYPKLETLFDLLPEARLVLEPEIEDRAGAFLDQIAEAHEARIAFRRVESADERRREPLAPNGLYLDRAEWDGILATRDPARLPVAARGRPAVPRSSTGGNPAPAFRSYVEDRLDAGERVVLAAPGDVARRRLLRALRRPAAEVPEIGNWDAALALAAGSLATLSAPLAEGFRAEGITVVAAADVLGSSVGLPAAETPHSGFSLGGAELRLGDAVIHEEHGVGVLRGVETVIEDEIPRDCLRLHYHGDTSLLVAADELDRLWRYGSDAGGVTLDRLNGDRWGERRATVQAQIAESAQALVALARERDAATAPQIVPPARLFARFVRRFPYTPTPDQASAIDDALADLRSGRRMERLVCGDVGYGKTEVALRAAAAVALSGRQVALIAPTTVLVRQHLQNFQRRFAGFDVTVAGLSRLTPRAEAARVKAGLADGTVQVAIGTHALAGKGMRFKDLALVIIDEEQRFGAGQKAAMQALGRGAHRLAMTATPIPRTLQTALVGLRDLSLIATPPARRAPIRTFVLPLDRVVMREALLRERRRGGQSFVVCSRIADLAPIAAVLREIAPDFEVLEAHGRMPAEALDETMLRFADGEGEVLLATNIIEAGLDVPAANTMVVWRPDRFGLAQLHQLRGRVGRGRTRGVVYLMTDPAQKLADATEQRLRTLAAADRLGAGFIISARDLDLRGAGDLVGEAQAGHMKLIGIELYQHLLDRALALGRGETPPQDWRPLLRLGIEARLPPEYVPEEEVRIGLYRRAARLSEHEVDGFAEEIEDRFGPPPPAVEDMIELARLRARCTALRIATLEAGPQAVAVTFRDDAAAKRAGRIVERLGDALRWRGERLIFARPSATGRDRLAACRELLDWLAQEHGESSAPHRPPVAPAALEFAAAPS